MKKLSILLLCLLMVSVSFTFAKDKGENTTTLISSNIDQTVVRFDFSNYDYEKVDTPQGKAFVINAPNTGKMLVKGAPDVLKMSSAMIIPNHAKMEINVIDSVYKDHKNVLLAPSKGNLLRTKNPEEVPFEFGPEYSNDAFYPPTMASLHKPFIARDYRGQAAIVYPVRYNPVTKVLRVYSSITVKVSNTGDRGENILDTPATEGVKKVDKAFEEVYTRHFINYLPPQTEYTPLNDPMGRMLIVCYTSFMDEMADFVTWKQSIGYTVDLVNYSTIGSSSALKTYVSNYYSTNGLTYLLLVGDHAQVPTSSTSAGDSDNNYGYIVGSDHYLDIFVGRFSAETEAHVTTQVNRTIYYERDVSSSASFFDHAIGMGSSEGPGHNNEYDYQHINNILTDCSNYGYTTHQCHQSGGSAALMSSLINDGAGTIFYCGHGTATSWYTTSWQYTSTNVNALTNEGELPFIYSVACVVGDFKNQTCYCETWMRATNNGNPTGSVAHCGSTINQSWEPPMDAQDEMADILTTTGKRTFGGTFVNGMFKMIDLNGSGGESMADTWTCFGDPSVQLRTPGTPTGPSSGPVAPVANFTADKTNIKPGEIVAFSDASSGNPTSWSWTFSGGTPSSSTAENPNVTYNSVGNYTVSLTATNSQGSDNETKTNYITVSDTVDYCTAASTNINYEWIAGVTVGSFTNTSGAAYYSDFTSMVCTLAPGSSPSVSLVPGFAGSTYNEYWAIFIDYNVDGDFDDSGEKVFTGSGSSTVTGGFTVPTGLTGTTRMRVIMNYSASPSPCGSFTYGEVEDYTVLFDGTPPADPIADAVDITGQTFSLSGSYNWAATTSSYYYGGDSAVSPAALSDNQDAIMETTISGVTSVKFYWKVSSEANYDYLRFYIDGVQQDQIAGTVNWTQKTYSVSSGSHTLKWAFEKDYSVSSGSDCGWVDKLELQ